MPQFLIELSHDDDREACVRALGAIARYGAHFVTHASWGCNFGVHSGWLIGEFENRAAAMQIVPPEFRHEARIVQVEHFSKEIIAEMIRELEG